jgi:uncharacterized protein (DUF362 family)
MNRSNRVFVTHVKHFSALASMDRLLQRFSGYLPEGCVSICVKVNLCDYRKAASGATTDPVLLDALLVALGLRYPGAEITILENDASSVEAHSLFALLGIRDVAEKRGARLLNVAEGKWVRKSIPKPHIFKELEVPEILTRTDLFINFAKLKTNLMTKTTGCLKNIFAFLRVKHKSVYHPRIDAVLADMNQVIHPGLCLVDGCIGMEGPGPAFGIPKRCELLIGGVDPVAVDACCARIMGFHPWFVGHIRMCHRLGLGNIRYRLETDIGGFSYRKYRFNYSRLEHYARVMLRQRVGIAG